MDALKPLSVVVIPFETVGDKTDEWFADGLSVDLITDLSRIGARRLTANGATHGRCNLKSPARLQERAFRSAILEAKSVAYTDPKAGGASGLAMAQLLDRMGIQQDIDAKAKLTVRPSYRSSFQAKRNSESLKGPSPWVSRGS